jgi:hypothetical protein
MAPRLVYDMICGVEIWLLRKHFPYLFGIDYVNNAYVAAHLELSGSS